MRYVPKKQNKLRLSVIVVLALIVQMLTPFSLVNALDPAKDITGDVAADFITGVDLREIVGTVPGNTLIGEEDLEKTTEFFLMYQFDIPNKLEAQEGDYIRINVPKEIVLPSIAEGTANAKLVTPDGDHIANFFTEGADIIIVFVAFDENLSNVGGAFYIAGGFDENEIIADGSITEIDFGTPSKTLELMFKADPLPELQPVTIQKAGQRQAGTDIEWKVTIDNELVNAKTHYVTNIENAVLVDKFPSGQELDNTTIKVDGVPVDPANVTVEADNTMRLELGTIASDSKMEITFVTKLTDEALQEALSAAKTSIDVTNTAILEHDDNETKQSNNVTVSIPLNILSKSGQLQSATTVVNTKNIVWTIVVNKDELEFNDAVIKDTLPTGLTFIAGTAKVDGAAVIPGENGLELTFDLGNINKEVTITYETQVDPAKFQANTSTNFLNKAVLTWDGLAPGAGVEKSSGVGVGSSLFTKSGSGYNRANGVITWTITINNENINLTQPTITDIIPSDQTFIEGSAKIVDHNGSLASNGSFAYDTGTATLSYNFLSDINSKYTITFNTKPASTELTTANRNGEFSNTANFKSGTIDLNVTGKQSFGSNVFKKDKEGYNKDTRIITWKFTVNENGATTPSAPVAGTDASLYNPISLNNVFIEDTIPAGLKFLKDKTRVLNSSGTPVANLVTIDDTSNPVTFTFDQPITGQYTIYIETEIEDESKFTSKDSLNNGNFSVTNNAGLKHGKTTINNTDDATQEIKNHIVSKKGVTPQHGDEHIDWVVYINSNAVNLNTLLDVDKFWFIDNLQTGLILDTTSVKLVQFNGAIDVPNSIPSNGNDGLPAGTDVTFDGTHVKYDATTREFRFNFPVDQITDAYKLTFTTYLADDVTSGTQFSNGINMYGSKGGTPVAIENSFESRDAHRVNFNLMGSMAYANLGKLIVNKVDSSDPANKLDATFALYDRDGNKVQEKTTVDGKLEFTRVKMGNPFYVKEVVAPTGYLLGGDVIVDNAPATLTTDADVVEEAVEVVINSASISKLVELTFENKKIKANIQFEKQDEENNPLNGAEFGLYPRGETAESTLIDTATSAISTGIVLFENVPYGEYDIREIKAPNGYRTLPGLVHQVAVTATDDGELLTYGTVSNELIKADIMFVKENDIGTGIAGAEFSLYDSAGGFVTKTVSKADGTVEFNDVLAGTYTIEETGAPFGYLPLTGVVKSVEVREEHHDTDIDLGKVTNTLIQASIEFDKHDENGQPLAGATFGLYNSLDVEVDRYTTAADGKVTFTDVGQGTYTIEEISAPTGYLRSTAIETVTITSTDNGKKIELDDPIVNTRIKADIQFKKHNETNGPLENAEFGLYPRGAAEGSTPINTAKSDALGIVLFENVEFGQYDIREITAPYGYRTLPGVVHQVEVTAGDHGEVLTYATVSNELIRANIKFIKFDDSGNELEGADFTLYNSSNGAVATVESDKDGIVEFKDILAGTYTIEETSAPFGYVPLSGVIGTATITEDEHGTTILLADVTNVLIQSGFGFKKVESRYGNSLEGATFELFHKVAGELIELVPPVRATSDSDGKVQFANVGEGSYILKEVEAPTGYELNTTEYKVSVTNADHTETVSITVDGQTGLVTEVVNTLIEADVMFTKLSDKLGMNGIGLQGAKFHLKPIDALPLYPTEVYEVVSNADGIVLFENVPFGKYELYEDSVPVGYNLINGVIGTIDINAANHGLIHPLDSEGIEITKLINNVIKGDIEFTKVAKNGGKPLKNARFALYAADDTTFANEIATAISDELGHVLFEDVEYGDYTIVEIVSPGGYYRSKDTLSASIRDEGGIYPLGKFENQKIPDNVVEGTIEINKVNTLGAPLAGAKFGLYNVVGYLVTEAVSNDSGIVRFTDIGEGVYTVKEIEAPINYVKSEQVEDVTIASDQNYAKLTFVNERSNDAPWPSVSVQKVDDAGKALAGVKFALYKASDTAFTTPVANSVTNASGIATFTNVTPGKYVVKEVEALEGYILSNATLPITVTDEAKIHDAGKVENRVIRGDIVVTKVNELNETLQGAKFGLYDKDGKLVTTAVSNSDGIASFNDIPYGSYNLKELTAPESYEKSDDVIVINITIDGKVQALTIVNTKLSDDEDGDKGTGSNKPKPGDKDSGTGSNKPDSGTGSNKPDSGTTDSGIGSNKPGLNNGKGNNTGGANQSNHLPKTGDSISTMIWLFAVSGLLIAAYLIVARRRSQKQ
ncbi:MAG TPA: LPXTG cell wall anchor domain-containing protein [Candidatus Paenibacillus intestinavium]|nr:LPXTG cell wall anchor domain-containing protein [Candidatus Paenibacillus intestinavium]